MNRTAESLKSRYHDYLNRVDEKDMKRIVNWVEKEGLEGFLVFEENDMKIQVNDPKEGKEEKKRVRASSLEVEGKKSEKGKGSKLKNLSSNCR